MISVVVPAKNEAGRLGEIIEEIISLSYVYEVIVVEGDSKDSTWQKCIELMSKHPLKVTAIKQSGKGKFNAVLEGAAKAKSERVMIWDADGTISLNDNLEIIRVTLLGNSCVIGNRLAGTISRGAMTRINLMGNHFFSLIWTPFLEVGKVDLFCGSKTFPRQVFDSVPRILKQIDTFGDLSLITTALMRNLKIASIPVGYSVRTYGKSNLRRWRVGMRFAIVTLLSFTVFIPFSRFLRGKQAKTHRL